MKLSAKHSIEPLEARIAPARTIIAGVPNALPGNDVDYTDTHAPFPGGVPAGNDPIQMAIDDAYFIDTFVAKLDGDTKIAGRVDGGVGEGVTFYLRMSATDVNVLKVYNVANGPQDFLTVTKGNIVAFFVDANGDNEVGEDELTGIAMGKDARITVKAPVFGDIVANLDELGTKATADDEIDMTSLVSGVQGIDGLRVEGGSVHGSIIAGGNITNVLVNGTVGSMLAGTAANGKAFDFFPDILPSADNPNGRLIPGGGGILTVSAATGKPGASISNIELDGLGTAGALGDALNDPSTRGVMKAGGGGDGGKGGAVTFVRIGEDTDGLTIIGGAGGASGGTKPNGGAGGVVSRIYIGGFPDPTNTVDSVLVQGGAGGESASGKGGAGGALQSIFVGYQFFGTQPFPTDDLLKDRIVITGGAGGSGKVGGLGGTITTADIRVETQDDVNPAAPEHEIAVIGGAGGGSSVAGGKAGAGGQLLNISVRNQDLAAGAAYADTLLRGGAAGTAVPGSIGAAGGNVTNATLLSWELTVAAGDGSEGKKGGNGGSVTNIRVVENDEILSIGARFDAGFGGTGLAGNGGKGGNINGILFTDSDLQNLIINGGSAANGGVGFAGKGGAGGAVTNVDIRDNDVSNGATQAVLATARTGAGGDGSKGGGAGGAMRLFSLDSTNMNMSLATGAGGDAGGEAASAGAKGKGGAGGLFETVSVTTRNYLTNPDPAGDPLPAFTNATAGAGGAGAGQNGTGGAGGDMRFVALVGAGSGFLRAGDGGSGEVTSGTVKGGAAGRGGNIYVSQFTATDGSGELTAGDAGAAGAKKGAGGSVTGQNTEIRTGLFAHDNLLIQAGNGSVGGAGGSVRFVGYGSGVITLTPTPMGNIVIQAGQGSALGKVAGVGGSVLDVGGSLPSLDPDQPDAIFSTSINAGHGGSAPLKGAAGGSVSDISILTGGHPGSLLTIQAGDAGDSANAKTGAKGGDVRNVTVSSVDLGTIFRSVVAGDGGDAQLKGGTGGNIDQIYADGIDIGDRRDVPFGLTEMGGIFAGVSGDGQKASANGRVTNIVAKGIASIVAGHGLIPEAVEFVDKVTLSGDDMLTLASQAFTSHGSFRLAYDAVVNASETTPGDAATQEVQTLKLWDLQSASAQIVYTFGADSTAVMPGDATAAEVQAALNQLDSIKATGPGGTGSVTVTDATPEGNFIITFDQLGNQTGVVRADATAETAVQPDGASATAVAAALNALPTIQYLNTDPETGLPKDGAQPLSVSKNRNGGYFVTYGEIGNVQPLEGIEVYSAVHETTQEGSITDVAAVEVTPGANALLVSELQSGGDPLPVSEFLAGTDSDPEQQIFTVDSYFAVPNAQVRFGFSLPFQVNEVTVGDAGNREVQNINLTAVKADPRGTFSLGFGGATTITLPSTATQAQIQAAVSAMTPVAQIGGVTVNLNATTNVLTLTFNQFGARPEFTGVVNSTVDLPVTATEVEYTSALNGMASIRFTAADRVSGAVEVVPNAVNSYFVNFLEDGDQPLLTLEAFAQERQEIESDVLDADPLADFTLTFSRDYAAVEAVKGTGTARERQDIVLGPVLGAGAGTSFTISYNDRTTAVLPSTATNVEVQAAINALGVGNVTVAPITGPTLQITFATNGDNPLLFTATAVSTTPALDATATEVDVEAALNALPTIKGPGAVAETVTVVRQDVTDNDFEVTFQSQGSRDLITAAVVTNEVQHVDATPSLVEATGSFRLGFDGEFTQEFDAATATASEVETALNNLLSIQAAGGVTVTSTAAGTYDVQFTTRGAQNELDIRFEVDEIQDIDYTAEKDLTLTVVNNVLAEEVIQGGALQELQVLTLGEVMGSAATFTLTINGETTSLLSGSSTSTEIADALNLLPSIIAAGGVTVETDDTTIQVTFTIPADQPGLLLARVTESAIVTSTATEAEVEAALNALATVKASGPGATGGSVDVTLGTGTNMTIRFNNGGNQEVIGATQEEVLTVVTTREGTAIRSEIQAFSPQPKGQPLAAAYAVANLIGFYADSSEIDSNVFHFIHNGVPTDATQMDFAPGDQPIDGILFAKNVNRGGLNVVPEAYHIAGVFYDWDNVI